ncbi:universal stress protein [Aurantimonas sp. HBX-1]|uniref:universal stress protein n=1 Tax=Aurantimonas sp. HBX-1 TaxID=2906072 RepID=UPI001F2B8DDB|nr:universal stress protein [Aurantimonas sp. HBX-1]UIJ73969.1 universal stress protein [Aurantimonas sp. HBX-1]
MADETFVVAYDGQDRGVVDYARVRAKASGARLHIVHVLIWSPYSFLSAEELEERRMRRREELERARVMLLDPLVAEIAADGITVECEIRFGSPVDLILAVAEKQQATMIFVGRSGKRSIHNRIFGSVTMGLAQATTLPTVIVP